MAFNVFWAYLLILKPCIDSAFPHLLLDVLILCIVINKLKNAIKLVYSYVCIIFVGHKNDINIPGKTSIRTGHKERKR